MLTDRFLTNKNKAKKSQKNPIDFILLSMFGEVCVFISQTKKN